MNHDKLRDTATTAFFALQRLVMQHDEDMRALEGRQYRAIQDDGTYGPESFLEKRDIDELYYALGTLGRLAHQIKDLLPEPEEPTGSWVTLDEFSI